MLAEYPLIPDRSLRNRHVFTSLDEALILPDSVFRLKLTGIQLEKIPDRIFNFTRLQELDLSDNLIEVIPEGLINLKNPIIAKIKKII